MNILIINCHSDNRGDEAAIHALVDELNVAYTDCKITLAIRGMGTRYPNMPRNVSMITQFCPSSLKSNLTLELAKISKGNIGIGHKLSILIKKIKDSDIILHAPGGPSIGDTYFEVEPTYLKIYDLICCMKKKYMFYAPSMGPFKTKKRNAWRRKILNNAEAIALRDPISEKFVQDLLPEKNIYLTLDSALQHDINLVENEMKFNEFKELHDFILSRKKCIGITVTDLTWHPIYSKNMEISKKIKNSFDEFLRNISDKGYGIVFIPQLYGAGNDFDLMKKYCQNQIDYFIVPANNEKYDAYFQQYIIGKLYAVIGMRYHSNIFSAKMGTPFISVSYEQKMQGFMRKMDLLDYCINIEDLSYNCLCEKFNILVSNYELYKKYLTQKHDDMKFESQQTTQILKKVLLGEYHEQS